MCLPSHTLSGEQTWRVCSCCCDQLAELSGGHTPGREPPEVGSDGRMDGGWDEWMDGWVNRWMDE